MPFSGPSSYLTTIDEFIGHWTDVDAALAPSALTLSGGYNLAALQSDRDDLATEITELEAAINAWEGHRTDRDNQKGPMRERMRQLGGFVRGVLAGSVYIGQIPDLIQMTSNPGIWVRAMDDHAHLWTTINATPPAGFTPPLTLAGGYTVANFNTHVSALKTTFTDLVQAEQDVDRSRDERDALYQMIRDRLVQYRLAVPGMFASDHPLVTSLPRLTPLPGHTPDPVVLTGDWDMENLRADLSWTASTDPDLASYQVRRSGATPYNASTEIVVDTLAPGVLALSTDAGLTTPGASMGFKVYVVLTTGNEKGSNAVTVTNSGGGPTPPP